MTQHLALLGVPDTEASEALTVEGFWVSSVSVVRFWMEFLSSDLVLLTCVPQATPKEQ